MLTKYLTEDDIQTAGSIIRSGGLVVFPTETVYGIGANAFDSLACKKIFKAKGRPENNPLIVHISNKDYINQVAQNYPPKTFDLIEAFWPGPLTLVLPKKPSIPIVVTAGLNTVGIRQPNHKIALSFLKEAGVPIAAPSANRSGKPSPTTLAMAQKAMDGRVDAIIDGGNCETGLESTVITWMQNNTKQGWTILRPGAVNRDDLFSVLGNFFIEPIQTHTANLLAQSPGTKHPHYKPRAKVILFTQIEEIKEYLLAFKQKEWALISLEDKFLQTIQNKRSYSCWQDLARKLYADFAELDEQGITKIFVQCPTGNKGIKEALRNRLLKASGKI